MYWLKVWNFIKKRFQHWFFRVNFVKFSRTLFLQNTSRRLFLSHCSFKYQQIFRFQYFEWKKRSCKGNILTSVQRRLNVETTMIWHWKWKKSDIWFLTLHNIDITSEPDAEATLKQRPTILIQRCIDVFWT